MILACVELAYKLASMNSNLELSGKKAPPSPRGSGQVFIKAMGMKLGLRLVLKQTSRIPPATSPPA